MQTSSTSSLYAQSSPGTPKASTTERVPHKHSLLPNPCPALVLRTEGTDAGVCSQVDTHTDNPVFSCTGAAVHYWDLCSSRDPTQASCFLTLCCFSYLPRPSYFFWGGHTKQCSVLSGTWGTIWDASDQPGSAAVLSL